MAISRNCRVFKIMYGYHVHDWLDSIAMKPKIHVKPRVEKMAAITLNCFHCVHKFEFTSFKLLQLDVKHSNTIIATKEIQLAITDIKAGRIKVKIAATSLLIQQRPRDPPSTP